MQYHPYPPSAPAWRAATDTFTGGCLRLPALPPPLVQVDSRGRQESSAQQRPNDDARDCARAQAAAAAAGVRLAGGVVPLQLQRQEARKGASSELPMSMNSGPLTQCSLPASPGPSPLVMATLSISRLHHQQQGSSHSRGPCLVLRRRGVGGGHWDGGQEERPRAAGALRAAAVERQAAAAAVKEAGHQQLGVAGAVGVVQNLRALGGRERGRQRR